MSKGLFISIEGPDGSGKSTQIENIKQFFCDKGIDIVFTREPGGTAIGERIREIILDKNCSEMDYMTEAMLYAAARSQHVAQVIRPSLEEGKIVICDRFVDSSIAYQGYGRKLGDAVTIINGFAIGKCLPDVTFLMKLDPRIGRRRSRSCRSSALWQGRYKGKEGRMPRIGRKHRCHHPLQGDQQGTSQGGQDRRCHDRTHG